MRRIRQPVLSLGAQIAKMKRDFPSFSYTRKASAIRKSVPTWRGVLQPCEDSPRYQVKITYRYNNQYSRSPQVWVEAPDIATNAPHRYSDDSLCLYYPKDPENRRWTPNRYISETIVPWTALWLAFYEVWTVTGEWYGPEAKHQGKKTR